MTDIARRPTAVCRFADFDLNRNTGELWKAGRVVRLPPQPARVLALLASRAGELVTREEIQQAIWGDRTFVDFELGLGYCLNRIRNALGDDARTPRYIETLPRRGYRFIEAVQPARPFAEPVLAVLPFENLSPDAEEDYLADGMSDLLTTELGSIRGLRVISRHSVLRLKGSQKALAEIARELGLDAVVEGSLLHVGTRFRVTVQLIQVEPEKHLWAHSYEFDLADLVTSQAAIARAVAEAVTAALTPAELGRLARVRSANPDAHLDYMKGRHHLDKWSRQEFGLALEYFQAAIAKDRTYAPAYAGLADCLLLLGYWGFLPVNDAYPRAKQAALRAVELDDALGSAHGALAFVRWLHDWDLPGCETEVERAVELNPSDEHAHVLRAMFRLIVRGDRESAYAEARLALSLDPLSVYANASVAWLYLFTRDYERAVEQAQRTLEMYPDSIQAHYVLGLAGVARSAYVKAVVSFERALAISRDSLSLGYLGHTYGLMGRRDAALAILDELLERLQHEHVTPKALIVVYAALGDADQAFAWLERAYQDRDGMLFWLAAAAPFDPLRSDPRFLALLGRLGLPP